MRSPWTTRRRKNDDMSGNSPFRVLSAVVIGTTTEYYDFFIYGTAAALVFGRTFFPHLTPVGGLLAAFSVYAVGFIGRPTGAAFFGRLGDRLGRKPVLIFALLLMGLSTAAVGLLPGYADWGAWSPVALTCLRFLQGVGLGGEFGGASLFATEHAPPGRRGRYGAFIHLGPCLGFALATGFFLVLSAKLPPADFEAWGWRLPFLASTGLVAFGLVARIRVQESPAFLALAAAADAAATAPPAAVPTTVEGIVAVSVEATAGNDVEAGAGRAAEVGPLSTVLRVHTRPLLLGAGTVMAGSMFFYTTTTWALSHATRDLHIPSTRMLVLLLIANFVLGGASFVGALLSDRHGRRRVIRWGVVAALAWSPLLIPLLDTGSSPLMLLGLVGAMASLGLLLGPAPAFLPELFPAAVRCSGASLTYNLGSLVGGAVAPLLATRLTASFGSFAVSWYLAAMCCVSLLCLRALAINSVPDGLLGAAPDAISYSGR